VTRLRVDPQLPLPELPETIQRLGSPAPALAVAGAARAGRYLLEGDRVVIAGSSTGALERVWFDGWPALGDLHLTGERPVNRVVSPGGIRTESIGPGGTRIEFLMAAPTLPLAALQWHGPASDATIAMTLLPGSAGVSYRAEGSTLSVTDDADPDRVLVAGVVGNDGSWILSETGEGARAELEPRGNGGTLVIGVGTRITARTTLSAAAHLGAHESRALGGEPASDFEVTSGVSDLDDAVRWAGLRVRHALLRGARWSGGADRDPLSTFWTALGAVAIGDRKGAQDAIEQLDGARSAFLAARLALTTGGARSARLTTLGAQPPGDDAEAAFLRSVFSREPSRGPPPVGPGLSADLLDAWASADSDPDRSWSVWRAALARGLAEGPSGPGSWDSWDHGPASAPVAGLLLAFLVHGVLGCLPDAAAGRLRLAPRLPAHITRFRCEGIPVGSARVSFEYERSGTDHMLRLSADRGRMPPMIVLEPHLPGRRMEAAHIDGAPAELDWERFGDRVRPRVQIPLDGPRVLSFRTT
jgi:hypothetical protein